MFQVYSGSVSQGDNLESLFTDVEKIDLQVAFYGLTPGIIDGFVLYTCSPRKKWEEALNLILMKLTSIVPTGNFYYKICPFAMFILKEIPEFSPLKRNIQYLDELYKNTKRKS